MITIENQVWAFVGTTEGELGLTNTGIWRLPNCQYIAADTNLAVEFPGGLQDGTFVMIDAGGQVIVQPPPDFANAGAHGIGLAFMTVGMILALKYVWRIMAATSSVPTGGAD